MSKQIFKKGAILGILFLLNNIQILAQKKEANHWFWGFKAGLNFNSSPPQVLLNSKLTSSLAASSISDSSGKWLFSNNKDTIWFSNGNRLIFSSLAGFQSPGSWATLVLPSKRKANHYFLANLFVKRNEATFPSKLVVFPVDLSLNGGLGGIVTAENQVVDSLLEASISLMLHADGKRNWLIAKKSTDTLLAFLVDSSGVKFPGIRSFFHEPSHPAGMFGIGRSSKTSPNSEILFWDWVNRESRYIQLLRFNRSTGQFYDRINLIDSLTLRPLNTNYIFPVDAAFSPNSKFLYTVENTYLFNVDSTPASVQRNNRIFFTIRQYDLSVWDSAAIQNSGRVIFQSPPFRTDQVGSMTCQLGPDGKIYFQEFYGTPISVLHCPNSPAHNTNFKFREINLIRRAGYRFPTHNQTLLRNAGIFQVLANRRSLCQGDTLELSAFGAGAEKFRWQVSPTLPQGVGLDTLTWQKLSTSTWPVGSYRLTCTAQNRCGDRFDTSLVITIKPSPPKPNITVFSKPVPCRGDSVVLSISNPDSSTRYRWNTGDSTNQITIQQTGLYSIVYSENALGCTGPKSDTVAISFRNAPVPPVPALQSPIDTALCPGQSITLRATSPETVVWSNGQTGATTTSPAPAKIWAFARTSEGCTSSPTDTIRLGLHPTPVLVYQISDSLFCSEREVVQQINYLNPDLSRVEAAISFGEILEQTNTFLRVLWRAGAGNRNVQLIPFSNAGCQGNPITFSPTEQAKPVLTLLPEEVLLCPGQATEQTINIQSSTADSIGIEVLGGSVVSILTNEIKLIWSAELNAKQLKVQAFTQLGCQGEIQTYSPSIDLAACQDQFPLQIPNVVTLNGDNKNDLLQLVNLDFHRPVKLSLFNRWGKTVFQTNDYNNNWPDGDIAPGSYFLVVESGGKVWKGMVEVVR